ncbi:glycerophosphoryl diester phosphodiesterase membrane domain-containing protein [Streptomyces sp. NPDC006925]|uniref:glycerophosphoryl diester phosphodiesterase membrane domain-containing protein n=1 Tax=Streptomyces sp. NPDC006925 TaxID=3364768 RepID=UPI0036A056C8
MNDSPDRASPGSASPAPRPSGTPGQHTGDPTGDDTERATPEAPRPEADDRPRNWAADQPPAAPQGWNWGDRDDSQARRGNRGQIPRQHPGGPRGRTAGPGTGPPGPGPTPGWNHNGPPTAWAHPPQAAKPGVVPLRPLGIGEILDGSVSAMRAHWRTALGIALVVAVLTELVSVLTMRLWLGDSTAFETLTKNDEPSLEELNNALTDTLSTLSVTWVVGMLGTVVATAMLTVVVSRAVLGRPVTPGEAWRDARPQLPRLLGLLLLLPLLVCLVLFGCLLPGILVALAGPVGPALILLFLGLLGGIAAAAWVWVRFCLAPPALMLEKQGLFDAMRRSAKLVTGSWWRILGIQLLTLVLITAISFVVSLPTTAISALVSGGDTLTDPAAATTWTSLVINGIGSVLASTVALPLSAGITALLYLDQRIRREALDLELARAAGVPGFEHQDTEHPAAGG